MDKLTKQELEQLRNIRIHKLIGVKDDGRKVTIKCPFHNEKGPSCVIFPTNDYYCFGCKAIGFGAIDFLEDLGSTFKEAVEELKKYL